MDEILFSASSSPAVLSTTGVFFFSAADGFFAFFLPTEAALGSLSFPDFGSFYPFPFAFFLVAVDFSPASDDSSGAASMVVMVAAVVAVAAAASVAA
jgi:hypothetical protein